ncbi:MAG: tetratricopeptide repeat protein [Planctomycetales bacterium]|nr:tetratricopeptide repeat protein [Planctomycetales bacterium]
MVASRPTRLAAKLPLRPDKLAGDGFRRAANLNRLVDINAYPAGRRRSDAHGRTSGKHPTLGTQILVCLVLSLAGCAQDREPQVDEPQVSQQPSRTFTRDVAPIVFDHCATCHRPGASGPFPLTTYDEVRDRAEQIVEVTQSGFMPPWLPEPGPHTFADERRLAPAQQECLVDWLAAGSPEGDPSDLPPLPAWASGWHLGQPDLIVEMPVPYELAAEGRDDYRNFVIPIPVESAHYVRAIEFRPQDARLVHHAFCMVNRDGESRRADEQDAKPGFDGMEAFGAESPDGHFISWQPGKVPSFAPEGTAWLLTPGTDLVLQLHMQTTGKPEQVSAQVGVYFTDSPPTRYPLKVVLRRTDIDIPAGDANHAIEDSFTLPVDVELMAVIPHAHYLGKTLEAIAIYPDGREEPLLRIPQWDFNWQGDYRYDPPVMLPRGTRLVQRFVYDNSESNVRNPHVPPERVRYGLQSTDEMGELWLQLMPRSDQDREQLRIAFTRKVLTDIRTSAMLKLRQSPQDSKSLIDVGKSTLALDSPQRAEPYFRRAIEAEPDSAAAHYYLGHTALRQRDAEMAKQELSRAMQLDPQYHMAKHDLGLLAMEQRQLGTAERYFRDVLQENPYHGTSLSNLALVLLNQGKISQGIAMIERAIRVRPTDQRLQDLLKKARAAQQQ